jgi:hypothetical protein
MGESSKNAIFKEIKNLLSFRVTRPEPQDCPSVWRIDKSTLTVVAFLLLYCHSDLSNVKVHLRSQILDGENRATPALNFASLTPTSYIRRALAWQLVQGEGSLRTLGSLKSLTGFKTGWREMIHWSTSPFLTPMLYANTFFFSHS